MSKATVRLGEGLHTRISIRQHTLFADEPVRDGGTDAAPTPMELLLGALGACVAVTTKLYANRKGWQLEGVEVDLNLERFKKADYPAYTGESDTVNEFRQWITFRGPLSDEQKERLLEIAARCPVHRVLSQPNFIFEELVEGETLTPEL